MLRRFKGGKERITEFTSVPFESKNMENSIQVSIIPSRDRTAGENFTTGSKDIGTRTKALAYLSLIIIFVAKVESIEGVDV